MAPRFVCGIWVRGAEVVEVMASADGADILMGRG